MEILNYSANTVEKSVVTGDASTYVLIALVVAALAVVGTLIYSKYRK